MIFDVKRQVFVPFTRHNLGGWRHLLDRYSDRNWVRISIRGRWGDIRIEIEKIEALVNKVRYEPLSSSVDDSRFHGMGGG
jgi:hypothetical protein